MKNAQTRRFTLIELLAVIAIITLLVGLIVGGVSVGMRKASEAKTRGRMHQLELALDQYRRDWGYAPVSEGTACSQYKVLPGDATNTISVVRWNAAFLRTPAGKQYLEEYPVAAAPDTTTLATFNDGFDSPFYYRCPGIVNIESYDLWSSGADGLFGGNSALASYASCEDVNASCANFGCGNAATAHKKGSPYPARALITADNDDITNWKRQ